MPESQKRMQACAANALHGERDVPTVGCVLGGVDQQVREHLLEAGDVRMHPERIGGQTNHQAMPMARHLRRNRVDRELNDCAQVRVGQLQRLLLPGVRCIQQFLDMPRHLADMAFDEHARSINAIFTDGKSQQSRRIAHDTERIAQLVRDRGDLIGARIGDAQRQHNAGQIWRVKRVVRRTHGERRRNEHFGEQGHTSSQTNCFFRGADRRAGDGVTARAMTVSNRTIAPKAIHGHEFTATAVLGGRRRQGIVWAKRQTRHRAERCSQCPQCQLQFLTSHKQEPTRPYASGLCVIEHSEGCQTSSER